MFIIRIRKGKTMEKRAKSKSRNEAQEELEYYIEINKLSPHDKLPSERELSELFEINRSTLRGAILNMIEEGKLYKETRSGNYVAEPKILRNLNDMDSLTKLVDKYGKTIQNKVLSADIIESNKQITKHLQVPLGTKVFQLIRLRYIDQIPVTIETSIIEYARFPEIDKIDFKTQSLYHVMETKFNTKIVKGKEMLGLTYATSDEAAQLEINTEDPIFFISGETMDNQDRPIEYFRSVVRSDKIKFYSLLAKENEKNLRGEY